MEGCRVSGGRDLAMNGILEKKLMLVIRVVLGAVFVYAGIIKIVAPDAFAGSIAAYKILPFFGNYAAAAILPWIELLCGIMLIVGYRHKSAATVIAALNLLFIAALASTLIRGLDIDCGCFRQGGEKTSAWIAMARDAVLLAMALLLLRGRREKGREA